MPRRLLALALALLGVAACDWTVFDDLALKAPIRAIPRPDSMDSNLYPTFVLPVTRPSGRGSAELLVLGRDNVALADFTFGPDGHLGTQTVTNDRFLLNGSKIGPLGVAAYLPDPASEVPRIVAVLEEERQPILVTLDSTTADFSVATMGDPLTIEAGTVAVGDALVAGQTDVVLTAGKQLLVMPDANPVLVQSCELDSAVVTLAVGDQWIVAGQPESNGGQVWLLTPPYDGPGVPCAQKTELGGGSAQGAVGFGTVVLATDTGTDGARAIVVSAPSERWVYFYSPAEVSAPTGAYAFAGGSSTCGSTIAVGTVEGKRTLIVGDPGEPGVAAPGQVWLQDLETAGADPQPVASPSQDVQRFGTQVGVVSFTGTNGAVDLVWVTAEAVAAGDPGVVYLYFWVQRPETEPREF
jgi:hypothetical protein